MEIYIFVISTGFRSDSPRNNATTEAEQLFPTLVCTTFCEEFRAEITGIVLNALIKGKRLKYFHERLQMSLILLRMSSATKRACCHIKSYLLEIRYTFSVHVTNKPGRLLPCSTVSLLETLYWKMINNT